MFEAMTDAFALAGSVLEQDANTIEPQSLGRNFQTMPAGLDRVRFARAARAARMQHHVIDAQQDRSLHLLAK